MTLTQLQSRTAREIVALARRERMKAGERLNESLLAERIGVSRSPVNIALRHLAEMGWLVHDPYRGYFLQDDAEENLSVVAALDERFNEPLYLALSQDRLTKTLPDETNETELMKRYGVSRSELRKVLLRIQQEGWIERQIGHGWHFLPMIDSVEAYEECYRFRVLIEPQALLADDFCPDDAEFKALKARQTFIAEGGFETMTPIELFEANTEFHETLLRWSGNRFMAETIRRLNLLRRLVEYSQAQHRRPRKQQALEHLAILGAITRQDRLQAATLLRDHLNHARKEKARTIFREEEGEKQSR